MQAAGIAGELAIGTDYPVAGDDNGDGIEAVGPAHRPGAVGHVQLPGKLTIAAGFTIGNLLKKLPDLLLERIAHGSQR